MNAPQNEPKKGGLDLKMLSVGGPQILDVVLIYKLTKKHSELKPHCIPVDISRKLACICYLACHLFAPNSISHSYCRFQGQSRPVDEAIVHSFVHMRLPGLSILPEQADPGRQSRWLWPVSQALTLWDCVARAAATGPGSLCQLVPDLRDSQNSPSRLPRGPSEVTWGSNKAAISSPL